MRFRRRGYTLIELMIVTAIIGILGASAVPLMTRLQDAAIAGRPLDISARRPRFI